MTDNLKLKLSLLPDEPGVYRYRNQDGNTGEYIGNFIGNSRGGEVKYSLSEMSRRDSMMVWDAIDELEAFINGENAE